MGSMISLIIVAISVYRLSLYSGNQCFVSLGHYSGLQYSSRSDTVGSPKCLVESKWMKVSQHAVRVSSSSDGKDAVVDDWLWIDYHDRINVLVEYQKAAGERRFLVFRQSKYALDGRESLAVVGGIIEPGESAEDAARREVDEELAMTCSRYVSLGRFRTDVNRGMGWVNSFIAMDCFQNDHAKKKFFGDGHVTAEVGKPDSELQRVVSITIDQTREAVRNGRFLEVQWSNTVSLAMLHYEIHPTASPFT